MPHKFTPDIHIYTASKVPWVETPQDIPAYKEFYKVGKIWAKETNMRRHATIVKLQALKVIREPQL
ncbi:hypothetical protein GQ44DRAFT_797541 [Phaeosphaeriaceae sp. PMI808]|nr:hypothetical protein GQ44DRAFT_797541 [Phaeosphaeriaceae sp. PMI808]